jgi:hypothetical protein
LDNSIPNALERRLIYWGKFIFFQNFSRNQIPFMSQEELETAWKKILVNCYSLVPFLFHRTTALGQAAIAKQY